VSNSHPSLSSLLCSVYDPLINVSTDSEGGRVEARGVGDILSGPPPSPLYEGGGRLRVGQGNVLSTAESGFSASYPRGEAVALGGRRRRRLRCRRRPHPIWRVRSSSLAAAAIPAVASLETRPLSRPRLAAPRGEGSRRRGGARGARPRRYSRRGTHRRRRYERHR
jgi:hypothetical protein